MNDHLGRKCHYNFLKETPSSTKETVHCNRANKVQLLIQWSDTISTTFMYFPLENMPKDSVEFCCCSVSRTVRGYKLR